MPVSVRLLGVPRMTVDGQAREPAVTKTYGLLYYLACHDGWVSRADAATLFWGESPDTRARNNLSKLLSRNIAGLEFVHLDVEPQRLRWTVECDVREFRAAVAKRDWPRAFRAYEGELMEGAAAPDAPGFYDWLATERDEIRRSWRTAGLALAMQLAEGLRFLDAADVMARLRAADPLDEEALRLHMTYLVRSGRMYEARSALAAFTDRLHDEVDGEPEKATIELLAELAGEATDPSHPAIRRETPRPGRRTPVLPRPTTPFIGRSAEAEAVLAALADPTCRVLTIVGPGGMGKTRLAIAIAEQAHARFEHAVAYAPLAAATTAGGIAFALADALEVPLAGRDDPWRQLCDALSDRETLLVLDNLEQLLGELSPLQDLLERCSGVQILATSRERLHVTSETVFRLGGLNRSARKDAEALFLHHARRLRPEVEFRPDELEDVARICELVEGMPLAIVLAASWVDSMPLAEIARDLERDLELLSGTVRDLPERHRSVRATFDASWRRLSEPAQDAFARLSVFRGGFTLPAAEAVASADPRILRSLVAQSFLTLAPSGRYEIHELLRQYGHEKLVRLPEDLSQAFDRHARFFMDRLKILHPDAVGGRQRWVARQIDAELENVRAALGRLVATGSASSPSHEAFWTLQLYFQSESRFMEGLATFERMVRAIADEPKSRERDLAWIDAHVIEAWFRLRFGQLEHIDALLDRVDALYLELGIDPLKGYVTDPDIIRAHADLVRGDHVLALRFAERVLTRAERQSHRANAQYGHNVAGRALLAAGSFERAREHAGAALAIAQKAEDTWASAYILNTLGEIELAAGDLSAARSHFRQSHRIRSEFEDPEGTARALVLLATVAAAEGSPAEARSEYERALAIYQKVRDFGGLVTAHCGLADLLVAQQDINEAGRHVVSALEIVSTRVMHRFALTTLLSTAVLLVASERAPHGLDIAAFVSDHPSSPEALRTRARELLHAHSHPRAISSAEHTMEELVAEALRVLRVEKHRAEASRGTG